MKRQLLKYFGVLVLISMAMGAVNLVFFAHINSDMEELIKKRLAVEQQVQQGQLLIGRIRSNIWDSMLFDPASREERIKTLDSQALEFFDVMESLEKLLPGDQVNLASLRREFQTHYLIGKEILRLPDLAAVQQSRQDISAFHKQQERLEDLIGVTFSAHKTDFSDALNRLHEDTILLNTISLLSVFFGAALAVALFFRLSGRIVGPIARLTDTVKAITEGDIRARADEEGRDEIGQLAAAFNDMTSRLRRSMEELKAEVVERQLAESRAMKHQRQLIQADKMASLGVLVAGVAHEINNPNQFIMSHITPLRKAWEGAEPILDKYLETYGDFRIGGLDYSLLKERLPSMFTNIQTGSERIKRIVDELRTFARETPTDRTEPVSVNEVVHSSVTLVSAMIRKATNNFSLDMGPELPPVEGHFQRLEQVVVNLLQNACQAVDGSGGAVRVRTGAESAAQRVFVEVEDEGVGIPRENLDRVTDPFFTTKRDSGGTGLGLSVSSRIVSEHGGELRFFPGDRKGTRVRMVLPALGMAPGRSLRVTKEERQ